MESGDDELADPQSVGIFAAVGAATAAFLVTLWKGLRKGSAEMPSVAPDRTIPPMVVMPDRDYGRRLDDLKGAFEAHLKEAQPMMAEFAVLKSRVDGHDDLISVGDNRVLKAIEDSEGRLDRRLAGIEAWMRRP